jgi:hypothetical protein
LLRRATGAKRKVWIRLKTIELVQDRESHKLLDGEFGTPPAEIAVESEVKFNPYVQTTLGLDVLVHEDKVAYRTPLLATGKQGDTIATDLSVFQGPVLDGMTELRADIVVQEVDWFPHWQVAEWLLDKMRPLAEFHGQVALTDGATFTAKSQYATCTFEVRVLDLY